MRTVLLSSVAAFALSWATGTFAQTPTPPDGSVASPTAAAPITPPPSTGSQGAADQGTADQGGAGQGSAGQAGASTDQGTMPAPTHRRHRWHHQQETANDSSAATGVAGEHWAHQPGTGESGPASNRASNIDSADTRSDIAPHLPSPGVAAGSAPDEYLRAAQTALQSHKTGEAQQALEMAETRLLDRSTPVGSAGQPDQDTQVQSVSAARKALAGGDVQGAQQAIQTALGGK